MTDQRLQRLCRAATDGDHDATKAWLRECVRRGRGPLVRLLAHAGHPQAGLVTDYRAACPPAKALPWWWAAGLLRSMEALGGQPSEAATHLAYAAQGPALQGRMLRHVETCTLCAMSGSRVEGRRFPGCGNTTLLDQLQEAAAWWLAGPAPIEGRLKRLNRAGENVGKILGAAFDWARVDLVANGALTAISIIGGCGRVAAQTRGQHDDGHRRVHLACRQYVQHLVLTKLRKESA